MMLPAKNESIFLWKRTHVWPIDFPWQLSPAQWSCGVDDALNRKACMISRFTSRSDRSDRTIEKPNEWIWKLLAPSRGNSNELNGVSRWIPHPGCVESCRDLMLYVYVSLRIPYIPWIARNACMLLSAGIQCSWESGCASNVNFLNRTFVRQRNL